MPFTMLDVGAGAYSAQAGPDAVDFAVLAAASALTGVTSGCAVTAQGTPNMTVAVAAGVARVNGQRVAVAAGNVTITTADAANPRWDLVTVDTSGALAAVAGTPAPTTTSSEAVFPGPPAGRVVLAAVYVPAGQTTIQAGLITDKRMILADPGVENVKWYGAVGDDTTNDTAAIQASITAGAAGGNPVYFPPSAYRHAGLTLANGARLLGAGMGGFGTLTPDNRHSRLNLIAGSNTHSITVPVGAANVTIRDLHIDGNGLSNTSGDCIHLDDAGTAEEAGMALERVWVENATGYCWYIGVGRRAARGHFCQFLYAGGGANVRFNGSDGTLDSCLVGGARTGDGIGVGGTVTHITGCDIFGNFGRGIYVYDTLTNVIIANNGIDRNGYGGVLVGPSCNSIEIIGNTFRTNSQNGSGLYDHISVNTTAGGVVITGNTTGVDDPAVYPNVSRYFVFLGTGATAYAPMGSNVAVAGSTTSGFTNDTARIGTSQQSADYVLYSSSGTTYAANGATGVVSYSGTDAGGVLASVLAALGTGGGTVAFKAGAYAWGSVPALRPNATGWVRVVGEPGATIVLSTGGPRFLDFGKIANNDTFRFINVEGFTVDASALSAFNQSQHIVIGTWAGSNGTVSGQDVNFDHITIRRIRTVGVRTDNTYRHFNVWIVIHATNNATQYTMTNLTVEDCEFNGGAYGVGLYGTAQSGFLTGANEDIWSDNIAVRRVFHDTLVAPTAGGQFAHVHLGSGAKGGVCWVEGVYGKNSWDVGVEIDNFETAYISDCRFDNYNGFALCLTNFIQPVRLQAQAFYVNNVVGYWTNASGWSSNACSLIGMPQSSDGTGTLQTFGRVIARNCRVYRTGPALDTAGGIEGDLALLKCPMIEFVLDGAQYYGSGWTHTAATGLSPTIVYTSPTTRTRCTLRDIDIRVSGTFGVGSAAISITAFSLGGLLDLLLDNCAADFNFTNIAGFSEYGIDVGATAGSVLYAPTIRKFRWSANDTGSRGIDVENAATFLTMPGGLMIEDCDFTQMATGGTEIRFEDTPNKLATRVQRIRWKVWPKATYTITPPATTVAAQYTDPWEASFSLTGGTVTVVSISRNNSTFFQVAAGTNVAWQMFPGDWYRFTYSVAPTLTVLPEA